MLVGVWSAVAGLRAGGAGVLAPLVVGATLLKAIAAYRRRGPDRSACNLCPERAAASACAGFRPLVRREAALRRLAARWLRAAIVPLIALACFGQAHARSVDDVVGAVDGTAGARMRAAFVHAGVPLQDGGLTLVAIKDERRLELWGGSPGRPILVRAWRILAASGRAGPKLAEGDGQVPEGLYRIDRLNPNSAFHLSLGLDYPNSADRARAARDGRTRLGGDIFIHGNAVSIGCLAIGDDAIEELFWLVATAGKRAFTVVIVPTDLRRRPAPELPGVSWAPDLYRALKAELERRMAPP